ncbi:ribonuclease HII [Chungangia koreensis]|uniref:Ribonuclease HII n=1 Tax=Chungangia koreensis TaxID=752657 RepID=A0ABV8X2A2_9LACT
MKSVKEIQQLLQEFDEWQEWMEELKTDGRSGVQKAIESWSRRYKQRNAVRVAHLEKERFDHSFRNEINRYIAGVDEAGRGPLAGPVVTAAVILPENTETLLGLNDSKQIPKEKRMAFASEIKRIAVSYAVHFQPSKVIDELNIYEATKRSMTESVLSLNTSPHVVLVDAMKLPLLMRTESIIKGDEKSLAIAAASILAKTARDEYMEQLDKLYPHYGFAKNMGYGTKEHLAGLEKFGPISEHRKSFEPIKSNYKG